MEAQPQPELAARIRALLGEEPSGALRALLAESDPFALADAFYHFAVTEQQALLGLMPPEQAADVLIDLDEPTLELLAPQLPPHRLALYIEYMEPDDAADVIGVLPPEAGRAVMEALTPVTRNEVTLLLTYGAETAGGIMDPHVVQVRARQTVAEAVGSIRKYVDMVELDDFFAAFVVDDHRRLVGAVPAWKMLLADPQQPIAEIMLPDPVHVPADMDQEEVSRLVQDHDLVVIPVVNAHGHLIGRVTVDDVVDVIQEEYAEDIGRLTGTGAEEVRELSVVQTLRDRAPWLLIALAGQLLAAVVMHAREDFLVTIPQLALFIPAIMAMGGNTGVQSASLVIRGLATGEVRLSHFWRRLGREVVVALVIGLAFAVILVAGGLLLTGRPELGLAVGLATLATIALASTAGLVIPMVLRRLELDPALATGPFLTTLNDVLGILIYLLVAYIILF